MVQSPDYADVEVQACCAWCYHRRHKRGALAAQVLVPRRWLAVWFDFGSALLVVLDLMCVPDTGLALMSSLASVFLFEAYGYALAVNLNWTAVSLMLAFPLQNAFREAYKRREAALQALADFRAVALNVFLANAVWDWPGADAYNGRAEDNKSRELGGVGVKRKPCTTALPPEHAQRVKQLLLRVLDAVQELLLVPRTGHSRSEFACGREEKRQVDAAVQRGRDVVLRLLGRLHFATEELKAAGMPANEASRINQYNMFLVRDFERLSAFKTYYTPIALRAMLRVAIQFLPFCYGPYWVYIMVGTTGVATAGTMAFACFFSSAVTLLLIAMVNLEEQMENPFRYGNRDTIRVKEEIELCRTAICNAANDLESVWYEQVAFDWEVVSEDGDSRTHSTGSRGA